MVHGLAKFKSLYIFSKKLKEEDYFSFHLRCFLKMPTCDILLCKTVSIFMPFNICLSWVKRFFCSPKLPEKLCGPTRFLFNGYQSSFLGVKRPGPEADHSPRHLVPRLRMSGALPLLPLPASMAWTGTALSFC